MGAIEMKNIVLTGFMGSGKSAVGASLAENLGMKVVDTDGLIEERMCMSINDIFSSRGEAYFREVEKKAVAQVSELGGHVIITGGGVVLNEGNIANLRRNGVIVYLHADPEVVYERVKDETHRPLLQVEDPLGKIKELMEVRASFYANNDLAVDTSSLTVEEVASEVLGKVKPLIGD